MITAQTIQKLLSAKHSADIYVSECKDGPTWNAAPVRLDGWAMLRSWSNPLTIGYEIKISRADFLADRKWHNYLPYCMEFYFVTRPGLIDPKELPPEAGLLVASTNGGRLFTKKKAARRTVEIPEDFWRYIVMCRAVIVAPHQNERERYDADYWRDWLRRAKDADDIGHQVSRRIREIIDKEIDQVKHANLALRRQHEEYDRLEVLLRSMGIDPKCYASYYATTIRDRICALAKIVPPDFEYAMNDAESAIRKLRERTLALTGRSESPKS